MTAVHQGGGAFARPLRKMLSVAAFAPLIALPASAQPVPGWGSGAVFDLAPPAGCTESQDNGWAALGLTQRPSWVNVCAERRLRLTPALPQMQANIAKDAGDYFGALGPGLSVGISLDDGLFYSQGFGWRDEARSARPDENTTFRAGSISKVMTATTLSTLVEDPAYHIALSDWADDPRYLPELGRVCAPVSPGVPTCATGTPPGRITIAELVSHTAGLPSEMCPNATCINKWYGDELSFRADLKRVTLLFEPGRYTAYSNAGAGAVGLIIAHVSGMGLAETVRQRLFLPLGMTHSSMDPYYPAPGTVAAKMWALEAKQFVTPQGDIAHSVKFNAIGATVDSDQSKVLFAAGGLSTSIWDLSRFATMWLTGRAPLKNGKPILSTATIRAATSPLFGPAPAPPPAACTGSKGTTDPVTKFAYRPCAKADIFAMGWGADNAPGAQLFIQHNGSIGTSGGQIAVDMSPEHPLAATTLLSTEPAPGAARPGRIKSDFLGSQEWDNLMNPALAADAAKSWAGKPLPVGIARLLWLSGVQRPRAMLQLPGLLTAYQKSLLSQFSFGHQVVHRITAGNVEDYVGGQFGNAHQCSTFRVRGVTDATTVALRLHCLRRTGSGGVNLDVVLKVDPQGRIQSLGTPAETTGAF